MKESFFMTNMGPQYFSLNRGRWKTLESQSAVWAQKYGSVYIVAGPIFIATIDTIGNNLHVPSHYFKALLVYNDSIQQAIGFVMPNKKLEGQLPEYAVTIDSLEKLTGLDLFYRLPQKQQVEIEQKINLKFWFN
jgi:endonuclease G, mitochondrial